jgi:hypothetical protein
MISKFYFNLLLILICILSISAESRAQTCRDLFVTPAMRIDIAIKDLAHLRLKLDLAQAQGVAGPQITALRRNYTVKETNLVQYLESEKIMSRPEFISRLIQEIEKLQIKVVPTVAEEEKKKDLFDEVQIFGTLGEVIPFHKIEADGLAIEKPFQLAMVPTTQLVWQRILAAAKQAMPGHYDFLHEYPSFDKGPLKPVEGASENDVFNWINALNALAAEGTPIVSELMPGHKPGDIYRLPTVAEWEFVASNRGTLPLGTFIGEALKNIEDFAWLDSNAHKALQPVATKRALELSGGQFYDLYGNVWELTSDKEVKKAYDTSARAKVRGGSATSAMMSRLNHSVPPHEHIEKIGFRLVRVRP